MGVEGTQGKRKPQTRRDIEACTCTHPPQLFLCSQAVAEQILEPRPSIKCVTSPGVVLLSSYKQCLFSKHSHYVCPSSVSQFLAQPLSSRACHQC